MQPLLQRWVTTWAVQIEETQETPTALLAFGHRAHTPVVLKVFRPGVDEWASGAVVRAFDGHAMVRALEVGDGAVLLERLQPGVPLAGLSLSGHDDEATRALADVLDHLVAPSIPTGCPSLLDWGRGFQAYLESGDSQVPRPLVERGQAWYLALAHSQRTPRLLHGDLHHYNVLRDHTRGWVAIDPKGVVGEPEYELGALFRNPSERLEAFAASPVVESRLRLLVTRLALDPDRVLAWAYAQAVLSAIWMVEDGHPVSADLSLFGLLRTIGAMIPSWP